MIVKHVSNISSLCVVIGVLLASACSIGHRERPPAGDRRAMDSPDPVDSLIDSMVKDRSTWVDPVLGP